jgi:hypothetical protein
MMEGQECKIGHDTGRALVEGKINEEGNVAEVLVICVQTWNIETC